MNAQKDVQKPESKSEAASKSSSSKFLFGSSDIRYRDKVLDGEIASPVHTEKHPSEAAKKETSSGMSSSTKVAANETGLSLEIGGVETSTKLPVTRDGLPDQVVKGVRDCLWSSLKTPPVIVTPSVLHYIRKEGDKFEEAVETLMSAKEIGVSIQYDLPVRLPRDGVLSLLCVSTSSDVYIFDVLEMGSEIFKWGLRQILQNPECIKVVHDGRVLSELLDHQYDLQLVNVFDTLAAHMVFASGLTRHKIHRSKSLHSAVRDYLGVKAEYLYITGERWLARPLEREEELLMAAARETIYLLELSHILQVGLELPVRKATQALMQTSLSNSPEGICCHIVPQSFKHLSGPLGL